jgi:hypothetical protein
MLYIGKTIVLGLVVIIGLSACKKTQYRPYLEWEGEWELVSYKNYGYYKLFGGTFTAPWYRIYDRPKFRTMSSNYTSDTVNGGFYLKVTYDSFPVRYTIKTQVVNSDSLVITEIYNALDTHGKTRSSWSFSNGFRLKKGVNEYLIGYYYGGGGFYKHWVKKDNELSFYDENGYPGSSGGNHYSIYRKFRKK